MFSSDITAQPLDRPFEHNHTSQPDAVTMQTQFNQLHAAGDLGEAALASLTADTTPHRVVRIPSSLPGDKVRPTTAERTPPESTPQLTSDQRDADLARFADLDEAPELAAASTLGRTDDVSPPPPKKPPTGRSRAAQGDQKAPQTPKRDSGRKVPADRINRVVEPTLPDMAGGGGDGFPESHEAAADLARFASLDEAPELAEAPAHDQAGGGSTPLPRDSGKRPTGSREDSEGGADGTQPTDNLGVPQSNQSDRQPHESTGGDEVLANMTNEVDEPAPPDTTGGSGEDGDGNGSQESPEEDVAPQRRAHQRFHLVDRPRSEVDVVALRQRPTDNKPKTVIEETDVAKIDKLRVDLKLKSLSNSKDIVNPNFVVVAPGLGADAKEYDDFATHLARLGNRVAIYDTPRRHGLSAYYPRHLVDPLRVRSIAHWGVVKHLVNEGVSEKCDQVGHSTGGPACIDTASRHPDHIGHTVVVDSVGLTGHTITEVGKRVGVFLWKEYLPGVVEKPSFAVSTGGHIASAPIRFAREAVAVSFRDRRQEAQGLQFVSLRNKGDSFFPDPEEGALLLPDHVTGHLAMQRQPLPMAQLVHHYLTQAREQEAKESKLEVTQHYHG